jgi:glycolate oxidase
MALSRDAYQALEAIVGTENISEDPAITLGYSYMNFVPVLYESARLAPFLPEAVVLPGSTKQVSEIMNVCGRYKVRFKAFSLGWNVAATVGGEGVILLDLRRMDHIIDIDDKNMYAVVEPWVRMAELEAEAEKLGLTVPVIGAGAGCSVLASSTSGWGYGMKGTSIGHNCRNLLGVEWVLPTGSIVRTGSASAGAWFTGDGPGPSLRGVIRGWSGALSGHGVFTKCATKLGHWPGPAQPERTGELPNIGMNLPENFKLYIANWPDYERLSDAFYKINDCEIGMSVWSSSPAAVTLFATGTNNEILKLAPQLPREIVHPFQLQVFLAGNSIRQLKYEELVLRDVIAETGGEFVPLNEEPLKSLVPIYVMYFVLTPTMARTFRPGGEFGTTFGAAESWDISIKGAKIGNELVKKWPFGGIGWWGGAYQRNQFTHLEGAFMYDHTDPEQRKAARGFSDEVLKAVIENKLGFPIIAAGAATEEMHEMLSSTYSNYPLWLKKIKKAIDPDNLADSTFYIEPE